MAPPTQFYIARDSYIIIRMFYCIAESCHLPRNRQFLLGVLQWNRIASGIWLRCVRKSETGCGWVNVSFSKRDSSVEGDQQTVEVHLNGIS